jgi:hypothetical protein
VGIVSALRSFVLGPVGSLAIQRSARKEVPRLEAEAEHERWFGGSSAGLNEFGPPVGRAGSSSS